MVTGFSDPADVESFLPAITSKNKPKYPDWIKKIENLATATNSTGELKVYAIYEVPDDKIYEALKHLNKRYTFYASQMQGYTYIIEIVGPIEDAIATLK